MAKGRIKTSAKQVEETVASAKNCLDCNSVECRRESIAEIAKFRIFTNNKANKRYKLVIKFTEKFPKAVKFLEDNKLDVFIS